jgi:hypothetical protein
MDARLISFGLIEIGGRRFEHDVVEISLTLNTYSHVMPSVGREAAERMDQLLGAGRP